MRTGRREATQPERQRFQVTVDAPGVFFFKLHVWVVGLYKVLGARPISVRSEVRLQREKKRITFSCFQLKKIKLVVDVLKSVTSRGFNSDSVGS